MSLTTRKMPSFEGVAAGQTATLRLPIGLTFHKLLVAYSGVTLAQMTEARLVANGKTIQRWLSGTVLDKVNTFDGMNAAAGVLTLDATRYGLRTRPGEEYTAIGTGHPEDKRPISTLSLEIDIDAAAAAPVLSCKAVQSAARPVGELKHVRVFGYDPAGAGEYEISDLPKMGKINRVIFLSAAAVINNIKLEVDNYTRFDRTKAENEVMQANGVRVPQATYYIVDFSEQGNGQDAVPVVGLNDLRFILDMAGGGHVDAIVEYIAPLSN